MPSILHILSSPGVLASLLALMTTGTGSLFLKSCSQNQELSTLRTKYTTLQEDYSRAQGNLAHIQSELTRQASEISRYNNLASQYKRELETKYTLPSYQQQDCTFDFTLANTLLSRQGN